MDAGGCECRQCLYRIVQCGREWEQIGRILEEGKDKHTYISAAVWLEGVACNDCIVGCMYHPK